MRGNRQEAMGPGVEKTLGWLSIIVSSKDYPVFPRRGEVAAEVVACTAMRHTMVRRLAR